MVWSQLERGSPRTHPGLRLQSAVLKASAIPPVTLPAERPPDAGSNRFGLGPTQCFAQPMARVQTRVAVAPPMAAMHLVAEGLPFRLRWLGLESACEPAVYFAVRLLSKRIGGRVDGLQIRDDIRCLTIGATSGMYRDHLRTCGLQKKRLKVVLR